jgi:hypothetical protein
MARYIDADKIKSKLQEKSINSATVFINTVLIGLIDDEPTADVVSVVRCKDCIHYKDEWCEILKAETPIADGFCCYGERKCDNDGEV